MRLVYVDEAGISKHEPFLVVAAVIVHADKDLIALERHLDRLVVKWIPEPQRDGFVFHATELFNGTKRGGGKPFERDHPDWPMEKRLAIADDLAAIPRKFRLPLSFGWLQRTDFPTTPEAKALWETMSEEKRAISAQTTAFTAVSLKVDYWLREHAPSEVCMMIVEDNEQARTLMRETQAYHQDKRNVALMDHESREHFPLRRIKEDPLFQKKRASSALQVADFVAYVWKKSLAQDERYRRFVTPMVEQFYRTLSGVAWRGRSS